MAGIGVFIDGLQGLIPTSLRKRIASEVKEFPHVTFCFEEEDLHSPEALARMAKCLEKEKVDRVLIIGGSPKSYETSFLRWKSPLPLNPYLVVAANLQEAGPRALRGDEAGWEDAKRIIRKAFHRALRTQPIDSMSLPLRPEALVIGGGIVGISVALELAGSGIQVNLLEKRRDLGGGILALRKFYDRPEEVEDWAKGKISEVLEHPKINVITQAELKRLDGHVGRFEARVRTRGGAETTLSASAIVVATGMAMGAREGEIWDHPRVISLATLERLLKENPGPSLLWQGKTVESVTFLLDHVNEDMKIDCINAIKQGLQLRETFQCRVAIFCKEVKVSADGMERLYRKAREKGVFFFRYEDPPKLRMAGDSIQVEGKDPAPIRREDRWNVSVPSDLVVLSEAFIPDPENEHLAKLLKLHTGDRGFLMEDNPQLLRIRTNRRGVFVAGGCRFPQEVSESLIEARAAAEEVMALLLRGEYLCDLAVAEVDPNKCAVCYTCPRLCPHAAITIEPYAERTVYTVYGVPENTKWGAAKVDPAACYGCGICVAECPARAIALRHLSDEQIFAEMNLME